MAPTPTPTAAEQTSAPTPTAVAERAWIELTDAPTPFLHDVTTAPWGWLGVGMAADSTDTQPLPATWRSTDGVVWEDRGYQLPTAVEGMVEALYQVEAFEGGFAALSSAPWDGIAVSEDGMAWSYEPLGDGACPQAIAANDDVLVAVGSIGPCGMGGGPGTPAIWVRDPEGWTHLDAPVSAGFVGVVATPYGFTAWGAVTESADSWTCQIGCSPDLTLEPFANAPWSSTDGRTWVRAGDASPFVGATIGSVAATDDVIVALGSVIDLTEGPDPIVIWTSEDGDAWSILEDALPFADANQDAGLRIGGGGALLAVWAFNAAEVVSATLWTSSDGEQWGGETTVVADLRGVSQLGDGLMAYGTASRSNGGGQEPCNKDEVMAGTCRNVAAAWVYAAAP